MARILIVDDNPDIAFMLREKLQHFIGGEIRVAPDGDTCLQMVGNDPPDLLLLDICMPGLDGFEVCRLLKEDARLADLPVIFLSSTFADLRSKIKGLDLGADDYLVQPVDDLELVTRIKAVLQIKTMRDQFRRLNDDLTRLRAAVRNRVLTASQGLLAEYDNPALSPDPQKGGQRLIDLIREITTLVETKSFSPLPPKLARASPPGPETPPAA